MLELTIESAKKFKESVKVMVGVTHRCWMQMDPEILKFGVWHEIHNVVALLYLHKAGFSSYTLSGNHLVHSTVEFDLRNLDVILNRYADTDPLHLLLDDNGSVIKFDKDGNELPISPVRAPYFSLTKFHSTTANRLRTLTMPPRFFSLYLQHSWKRLVRIAFRICLKWVVAISTEIVAVYSHENYRSIIETGNNKFPVEVSIRAADYLASAAAISETILLHLSIDPTLYPDIVPFISFNLDAKTVLTFILPFDCIMGPRVF